MPKILCAVVTATTDKSFINFDNAAELLAGIVRHSKTDAVSHEPRGFVGHAKHAVQLMAAHAFLGRTKKEYRLQPDIKRDLGTLEYGANGHTELLAAVFALHQTRAVRLALQGVMVMTYAAAMRADRAIGPAQAFKVFAGLVRVLEVRLIQVGSHSISPVCG
jgi:hypothetical protein